MVPLPPPMEESATNDCMRLLPRRVAWVVTPNRTNIEDARLIVNRASDDIRERFSPVDNLHRLSCFWEWTKPGGKEAE